MILLEYEDLKKYIAEQGECNVETIDRYAEEHGIEFDWQGLDAKIAEFNEIIDAAGEL